MKKSLMTAFLFFVFGEVSAQTNFIDASYKEAFAQAKAEGKYLFIDCYTDWCGWCKVADEKTFPAPVVANVLNEHFISVKVDMERGEGVYLGMKYRVLGYPAYLMFTPEGKLAGKMFGYMEDPADFAAQVKRALDESNHPAYPSGLLDKVEFPDFYVNSFANKDKETKRTNPEPEQVNAWLNEQKDLMGEAAWSVMYKFPVGKKYNDLFLKNRDMYAKRYGEVEVAEKVAGMAYAMLQQAMKSGNEADLQNVLDFADLYVEKETEATKSMYRLRFCQGKGNWSGYAECVQELIDYYGFDNFRSDINNYSWAIYEGADNKEVITTAIGWMEKVVLAEPEYAYLDTYAALLYKAERYEEAHTWALKAIEKGKADGDNVQGTEELRDMITAAQKGN